MVSRSFIINCIHKQVALLTMDGSLSLPHSVIIFLLSPYACIFSSRQGDGISYETITDILENMKRNKWSTDNVAFGSGGALLQRLHRDTQKCAYKCSYAIINGKGVS